MKMKKLHAQAEDWLFLFSLRTRTGQTIKGALGTCLEGSGTSLLTGFVGRPSAPFGACERGDKRKGKGERGRGRGPEREADVSRENVGYFVVWV